MQPIQQNHARWNGFVSMLCVVLMLAMGTAQAIHVHPHRANTPRHTCSICSAANAKVNTTHFYPVPVIVEAPLASVENAAPRIFRPATANFVRPPPAA